MVVISSILDRLYTSAGLIEVGSGSSREVSSREGKPVVPSVYPCHGSQFCVLFLRRSTRSSASVCESLPSPKLLGISSHCYVVHA